MVDKEVAMNPKINLQPRKVRRLLTIRTGSEIRCLNGTLWITQSGDLKDYILERGEKFIAQRKGNLVLQALQNSTYRLN